MVKEVDGDKLTDLITCDEVEPPVISGDVIDDDDETIGVRVRLKEKNLSTLVFGFFFHIRW
jgi:hypothetical protein